MGDAAFFEDGETNHFRSRVKLEAARKGWSLADLARACNKTPQALDQILKYGKPNYSTVEQLAKALGVATSLLFEPVDPKDYGEVMLKMEK
jgi:transcriptional regulator with XRE-family HTH domain